MSFKGGHNSATIRFLTAHIVFLCRGNSTQTDSPVTVQFQAHYELQVAAQS